MLIPFAAGELGGYSLIQLAIAIVVIIGVCAIVWVVVKYSGVPIPQWFMTILGILALVIVAIVAIKIIASL